MNERIIIIAPVGNDAAKMASLLKSHGFQTHISSEFGECCRQIGVGAGALLFTEEALELPHVTSLLELLKAQSSWSAIPLIILSSGGESRLAKLLDITANAAGGIMLLERPISTSTLLRSVEVALRSRKRQYQVRDLIEKQQRSQEELEERVRERTFQLEEQAQQLRQLAVEMSEIEESERKRLAQVLHDHLQQLLVAAKLRLEIFNRNSSASKESLKEVFTFLQQAYDASRSLTAELRPPVLYEGGLVPALYFLVRKFQDQHHHTVNLSILNDVEPHSDVFKTFIYQSIQELLFNIVKYSGQSESFLTLERLNKNICITLRDEGIGFDPQDIGKKGTGGFGLFSIRERMKALGGEFKIASSLNKGSTFIISIPDLIAVIEEQSVKDHGREIKKVIHKDRAFKVLIVDDHKIVRQSLSKVLRMEDFIDEIIEAEDGKDSLLKVAENNPDVVLMDLNMPNMNGMEATRILHQRNPNLRIIGLSVQSEEEIGQAMKKAGAMEYFNKNTDTDILVEKLKFLAEESLVEKF